MGRTELGQVGCIRELGVGRRVGWESAHPAYGLARPEFPVGWWSRSVQCQFIVSLESTKGPALPACPTAPGPSAHPFLVWWQKAN